MGNDAVYYVPFETCSSLSCIASTACMVCLSAANYVKQSATEVDGLQWDGGEHFCVSASQQMCFDDAFSLMMVSSTNSSGKMGIC